ncbi:hypothetical protein [Agromyces atrinae]|uniref:O-antigen ligase domain-containing protein n=1 Tax=Agromyces atrinae TaxID=592376 RepID=A0A4Q2M4S7_9MICO|nr:hypothetical protein [Agromyces atrinae]NYD68419.1 hypothetical protein [Agromyces atrinae]RXZ85163.1 hypothetical protein ESP50_16685 [Agromyces atrinae]
MSTARVQKNTAPAPALLNPRTLSGRIELRTHSIVGLATAAVIGMRIDLPYGLRVGTVIAILLIPVWLPTFVRIRSAVVFSLIGVAAVVSGVVLTSIHSINHASTQSDTLSRSVMIIGLIASTGALVWAARAVGVGRMCLAFSVGMVLGIPFNLSDQENAWRFTYSIAIGALVLTIASLSGRLWVQLAALLALALVGAVNDSRSNSAMLLLAAVIIVWQRVSQSVIPGRRGIGSLLSLVVAAVAVFLLVQSAILEGYFGEATQARTQAQLDQSGSVLLGGRPEIAASTALISEYPFGMGSGTNANFLDILSAKMGMASIGYDPNNGYVERYLFGGAIEVHSMLGDFWIWFGLAGLALGLMSLVIVIRGFWVRMRDHALTAIYAYLTIRFLWDLAFSPAVSATRLLPLILALGLVPLLVRRTSETDDSHAASLTTVPWKERRG